MLHLQQPFNFNSAICFDPVQGQEGAEAVGRTLNYQINVYKCDPLVCDMLANLVAFSLVHLILAQIEQEHCSPVSCSHIQF